MSEIKVGDTVRLKSGGPIMTVSRIDAPSSGQMKAWCDWFDKDKKYNGSFPLTSLVVEEM